MVRLKPFFGLCPLIDQRSLLGVSEDVNKQCVIVTLSKNIATKYKLSDQKPLHSWSTKERLTSPVIYDESEGQYLAVFNYNVIRMFGSDGDNLDRIKKQRFQSPIHTIIKLNEKPALVVFKNGIVSSLSHALTKRKELLQPSALDKKDTIEHHSCIVFQEQMYVGLLVKTEDNAKKYVCIPMIKDTYTEDTQNIKSIKLIRSDSNATLISHLLKCGNSGPELLTLWSDKKLYSFSLLLETAIPGRFVSTIESINCSHHVLLSALSANHIAMYGADTKEDGALLIIYNTRVAVTQCQQHFKLFSVGAQIWNVLGNLLLTVGNHLAVIPFELDTEQFAGLIGSHRLPIHRNEMSDDDVTIINEMETVSWTDSCVNGKTSELTDIPQILKQQIEDHYREGLSDSLICQDILPQILEKKDIESILWSIDFFNEISEYYLVKLISFCLNVDKSAFRNPIDLKLNQNGFILCLQPLQRCELMNNILNVSYSDTLLLPYLRTNLNFGETLTLLQYICLLLSENELCLPDCTAIESEKKVIEWGTMLLDSHFQEFLLSKDPKVLSLLRQFQTLVNTHLECIDDYKTVIPILDVVNRGKNLNKLKNPASKWYSIEKIQLY